MIIYINIFYFYVNFKTIRNQQPCFNLPLDLEKKLEKKNNTVDIKMLRCQP